MDEQEQEQQQQQVEEQAAPQNDQNQLPQPQGGRREVQPQFVRAPPIFKRNKDDLELYLKRFSCYCAALNCPEGDKANLLISLLDDRSLGAIERNLTAETTYEQLMELLRVVEGYDNNNSEMYVVEMRNRRRARNESIRDFHLDLYRLATRGWPNNQQVREAMIREQFISGIGQEEIAARLREHPELNNEEILNLAITLHACRRAARSHRSNDTIQDVNSIGRSEQTTNNRNGQMTAETEKNIETILNMVERISGQQNWDNDQRMSEYTYRGPKWTPGLRSNYDNRNRNTFMMNNQRQFQQNRPDYRNSWYQQKPRYNLLQGGGFDPNWTPN